MLKTKERTKNWFKLRGKEYSCNDRFFREHQIMVVRSGGKIKFSSALEPYLFKEVDALSASLLLTGYEEDKIIEEIHDNLLNGKYGRGEFTN